MISENEPRQKELTSVRASSGGHEEVRKGPDLAVRHGAHEGTTGKLVGDRVASVRFDPGDSPGLLVFGEELGLFGKVDNEEEAEDGQGDGDETKDQEDCYQLGPYGRESTHSIAKR